MYDLVGNPEDRFSHNEAHIKVGFEEVLITRASYHDVYVHNEYMIKVTSSSFRPDMTEKMFTGTLNKTETKTKPLGVLGLILHLRAYGQCILYHLTFKSLS